MNRLIRYAAAVSMWLWGGAAVAAMSGAGSHERMFEWSFDSDRVYADPFNDVDVDVVFSSGTRSWKVPAFWRGGRQWSVRFAPPAPGEYNYRVESTDRTDPSLNGREGRVSIAAYRGPNALLKHGALRVSAERRHFEHADGTPFFWLGDTWWSGLSDRLSWEGFKKLTADRRTKGFSVVQIVGGLIPSNEEQAPSDPGFCNEGGCVYDDGFERINPRYFDYADRRIQYLLDAQIVPAIVGGWHQMASEMGAAKLKKHWRYLIARYGAYPVFWIVGGEVASPPAKPHPQIDQIRIGRWQAEMAVWQEVARYIRETDPYRHPVTLHEANPPLHGGFQDRSLTDFDLVFPSHLSWATLATEVVQVSLLYSRAPRKPIVVGEIGYEQIGGEHLQDFQRAAFWLAMLNGAAGFTYGTIETAEAYSTDKPLHRYRWSFETWEEAMSRPGAAQVALNAGMLRRYSWHRFVPHPEWVMPRGTTLFEPNSDVRAFDLDVAYAYLAAQMKSSRPSENEAPSGAWQKRHGSFRAPYAAGIPGQIRVIYIPYFGAFSPPSPTVLNLESGVRYRAWYWDPTLGIKVDLGNVERPQPGEIIFNDSHQDRRLSTWKKHPAATGQQLWLLDHAARRNLSLSMRVEAGSDAALIFRYQHAGSFVAATYSASQNAIFIRQWLDGEELPVQGKTDVDLSGMDIRLSAELRDGFAIVSVGDGTQRATSPIVALAANEPAGAFGVAGDASSRGWGDFEARQSPELVQDVQLDRKLYDARGHYRGQLAGVPEWDQYGRNKLILLDAYRPERAPFPQDWILVLERQQPETANAP